MISSSREALIGRSILEDRVQTQSKSGRAQQQGEDFAARMTESMDAENTAPRQEPVTLTTSWGLFSPNHSVATQPAAKTEAPTAPPADTAASSPAPAASTPAPTASVTATPAPASAPASTPAPADPVSVLKEAMQKAGMNPDQVGLTEFKETVWFPGANYEIHMLKADFGNGVTEQYDVALMLKNPKVTIVEMQRLMRGTEA